MRSNGKGMAKNGKKTLFRLIRTIFGFFPVLMPLVLVCILFNAIVGSIPAIFMQKVIAVVEEYRHSSYSLRSGSGSFRSL